MSFEPEMIARGAPYIALGVALVLLVLWNLRLERRLVRLLRGKNGASLEETIRTIETDLKALVKEQSSARAHALDMNERLTRSIQGVSVVRFNPFKGILGSNQSFSAAFLDERGNGAVISSLYSRDRVSTFAKPLKNKSSEYELTPEEKEAVEQASVK